MGDLDFGVADFEEYVVYTQVVDLVVDFVEVVEELHLDLEISEDLDLDHHLDFDKDSGFVVVVQTFWSALELHDDRRVGSYQ